VARFLVAFALLAAIAAPAGAQVEPGPAPADTSLIGVRLPPPARAYTLTPPAAFSAPWLAGPRYLPSLASARWEGALGASVDSARAAASRNQLFLQLYGVATEAQDSTEAALAQKGLFGISRNVVDLNLDGTIRLEIRTDRLRNERCTAFALADPASGCRTGFTGPRIDNQLSIRSGGVIGRRLRLNVDWDTQRDFSNTNNIQVYYEGLEDEIVRRVEVGSVAFRPPPSRFLTAALPTNNFGVNTLLEAGAVQLQLMAATQKGSAVAERTFNIGGTAVTPQDRTQRDLDFEYGRFFWVVDPRTLPNFPAVDVLTLDTLQLAAGQRPADVRLYRYRVPQGNNSSADPNLGGIPACARQGSTGRTFGPVQWQLLVSGVDYWLDPSGLWVALAQRVDTRADYLAVSYVRQDGSLVGSFPSEPPATAGTTCATVDSLQMINEPLVGAEQPSFHHEMRNVYRVAGRDLEVPSLQVTLTVNRSERPVAPSPYSTYLSALGLAVPTDANVVDRDNRLFPRVRDPGADQVLRESFLVFPNLQPFADPTRLQPTERSDSLYRTPIYLLFTQGPPSTFQFRLRYNSAGAGDRSTLSLNALQVREGSERIAIGGRVLERGVDYSISYETGEVTFLNPDLLFGTSVQTVTVRFEERGVFAIAPTSIFGASARYDLGRRGAVNVMSLYQREQSAYNRPQLGFEAAANLIAGANTELHFRPTGVSRFLNSILPSRSDAESFLDLNAEVAFSRPDPNRSGQAYLEEFEGESGIGVALRESAWEFGSVPLSGDGLPPSLGFSTFERADAVQLIWQNLIPAPGGGSLQIFPQDIDPNIQTAGTSTVAETVMYLTLHADTAGGVVQRNNTSRWTQPERPGRPRWRSFQTSLSAVGTDFTRNEFLEFWVYEDGAKSADAAETHLVLDLGSVNEDALGIAPDSLVPQASGDTLYRGRQYVGEGILDTERRPNGIFNAESDDLGILGDVPDLQTPEGEFPDFPLCEVQLSDAVPVYPWGDLSARCTRRNGFLSTEDLDGDNTLNARGPADNVFRFVVPLGDPRFVARVGVVDPATGAGWRLYRVPLRIPDAVIGAPNLRLIQHLRVTVAAPDQGGADQIARFALARVRFVGSPWVRRADAPIAGLSGSTAEPVGEVVTAIISTTDSTDLGYVSPPGVVASVDRRDQVGGQLGTQVNERSLRIIARSLAQGTRAEAYLRFPSGPQRFLGYRQLRVWMRGRRGAPGWESGELQGFVKVGSDDRNFYLYRTNLRALGGEEAWEPELQVDLSVWATLRAQVETRWLNGEAPSGAAECGGDPQAYVACEGHYLVQVGSPGVNPPNLASVQEIAAGIIRLAPGTSDSTEVWVDDIRLADPVAQTGTAYALQGRFVASDVADVSVLYAAVDGQFRQIGTQPTFRSTGGFNLASNVRLDRFLPASMGLLMPLTITYARTAVDPELLTGTDIAGEALPGLRKPESNALALGLVLRRSVRSRVGWMRALVDPLTFAGTLTQGRATTELSEATNENYTLNLAYNYTPAPKTKSFSLAGFVASLPKFLRQSDAGNALRRPTFNLLPSNIRLSSGLTRDQADFFAYSTPIRRADDAQVVPTLALNHFWRNQAGLSWQPIGLLTLGGDYVSTRDLRDYGDTTSLARLASASRETFLGMDVGVERDRRIATTLAIQPRIASWLRPRWRTTSTFTLLRTLNSRSVVREFGDSAGAFYLPQTYNNSRTSELGFSVDYGRGLRQLAGDSSSVANLVRRFRPLEVAWTKTRLSSYDLATFSPSLGYQLALGGFDQFLTQEGQRALGASATEGTTLTTGLDFPFGLTATINYNDLVTQRFQQVNEGFLVATITQREWPSGALRFTRSFRKGTLTLLTVGAGLRERRGSTVQPSVSGTGAVTANQSRTLNPELQLGFRNGLNALASLNDTRQESETNGSTTQLEQNDLTTTLSYPFRLPFRVGKTRRMARSTFTALFSRAEQCLQRRDAPECQVISDTRRQEFRGSLDTDIVSTMTLGLQVGYTTNELRHLDRKTSQIFLLLTFTVSLFSGDYR
jgi:hypothetical protein